MHIRRRIMLQGLGVGASSLAAPPLLAQHGTAEPQDLRTGEHVRFYRTVRKLLAATDSIAVGEIVQAAQYVYRGAASGATDHHIANAGGAKLYCVGTPYVTPEQFGAPGYGDETRYVQAAIASGYPVFLDRMYGVTNVYFPGNWDGITIHGNGYSGGGGSGLKGLLAASECILQTCEPGDSNDSTGHDLRGFSIRGLGKRGLGICQVINSTFENLFIAGPTEEAIVMEQSFSNVLRNIQTGYGAKVDMLVGQTVLNTIVDMFYTNNAAAQNHILVDPLQKKLSAQNSAGHGLNIFNSPALQGSRGYAIKLAGSSAIQFTNVYTEAITGALLIKDCDQVQFFGGGFNSNEADHGLWIDQTEGAATYSVNFFGSELSDPVVVGNVRSVEFYGCRGAGAAIGNILRTSRTPVSGSSPINIASFGENRSDGGNICLRCSDDASKWSRITVASDGTVSGGTPFTPDLVDHEPHMPVIRYDGTGTPAWTQGVAITPITPVCIGGTAPYRFQAWSGHIDRDGRPPAGVTVDPGTGAVRGTPTQAGSFWFRIRVTDANGYTDATRWIMATVT